MTAARLPSYVRSTLVWWTSGRDEHNEAHIADHGVTPAEVEQVVFNPLTRWATDASHRPGRLVAFAWTVVRRPLVVVCDTPTTSGLSYVVTARPMNSRERRAFEERENQ